MPSTNQIGVLAPSKTIELNLLDQLHLPTLGFIFQRLGSILIPTTYKWGQVAGVLDDLKLKESGHLFFLVLMHEDLCCTDMDRPQHRHDTTRYTYTQQNL